MAWYLNRALTNLRNEVNATYPNRDKTSDGTIGDLAHQNTSSDHNPDPDGSVDAWDMDIDGVDVWHIIDRFERHEAARYWIYNRQIASRSTGWRRERYDGPNPHDKHVHLNTREQFEDSTKPWGIHPPPAPPEETVDAADVTQIATGVWTAGALEYIDENGNGVRDVRAPKDILYATHNAAMLGSRGVTALTAVVEQLAATIAAGGGDVDTAAILAGVDERLAALPTVLADAVNDDAAARLAG